MKNYEALLIKSLTIVTEKYDKKKLLCQGNIVMAAVFIITL